MTSDGEGNGTLLQYFCLENPIDFCLENPIDGGAWWAAVHVWEGGGERVKEMQVLPSFLLSSFLW